MSEFFRQELPPTSEKPTVRLLEARALLDMFKRNVAKETAVFAHDELIELHAACGKNPHFEKDLDWIREKLVASFEHSSIETKLATLETIHDSDPARAEQLMQQHLPLIKKQFGAQKRSEDLDAKMVRVIHKLFPQDQILEMQKQVGYQHPLDGTLRDHKYNDINIPISHLNAPELRPIETVSIEKQLDALFVFLDQVARPAELLKGWSGGDISKRKKYLVEQANKALSLGVDLIQSVPIPEQKKAGERLFELVLNANQLLNTLTYTSDDFNYTKYRNVTVPLHRIDQPKIFESFLELRADRAKHEPDVFEPEIEFELLTAGIEQDVLPLVLAQMPHAQKGMEALKLKHIDPIFTSFDQRAKTNDQYQLPLQEFQRAYVEKIKKVLPKTRGKGSYDPDPSEVGIVETRMSQFLDPVLDTDQILEVLELMNAWNTNNRGYSETYFPTELIQNGLEHLSELPPEKQAELYTAFEKHSNRGTNTNILLSRLLTKTGLWEQAALYAGNKDLTESLVEISKNGSAPANDLLWKTKGWDPTKAHSSLVDTARSKGSEALADVVDFTNRYFTSSEQLNRDRSATEDAFKIEEQLKGMITPSEKWGTRYDPSFSDKEKAAVREQITTCRTKIWELWQKGNVPHDTETREKILMAFVEDGRDLSIVELGLSAQQKVDLGIAKAKVALANNDLEAARQFILETKRLKGYENSDAQKRVTDIENERELLVLKADVTSMPSERLRTFFEQSGSKKSTILDLLIDAGRTHDALTICGELGVKDIVYKFIEKGALDAAEELIQTAPEQSIPQRELYALLLAYKKAGGKPDKTILSDDRWHEDARKDLTQQMFRELPDRMRAQGRTEAEILETIQNLLPENQRQLVQRCLKLLGEEVFLLTVPSYEPEALKQFYLDGLLDKGKKEEAIRFTILQGNDQMAHLIKRFGQSGDAKELEPFFHKITDLETAHQVSEALLESHQPELAKTFVKRFVLSLNSESVVFKNVISFNRNRDSMSTSNRAPKEEQENQTEQLTQLILETRSFDSLAHLSTIFSEAENNKKLIEPIFRAFLETNPSAQEFAKLFSAFQPEKRQWFISFIKNNGSSQHIRSTIRVLEQIMPREEAMKKYHGLYITEIALSAKEDVSEDLRKESPQKRVEYFVEQYKTHKGKETLMLASLSLSKQEWNRFTQTLPTDERERAIILADWYASPRLEEQDLGPIIERAASNIPRAIKEHNQELLRVSLDTLLSAHTPEAASKLTRILKQQLEESDGTNMSFAILRTLSKLDSFKANTVLLEILSAKETPDLISRALIRLLVENGHLDADLRAYFEEKRIGDKTENGKQLEDAVNRFRLLIQKYGINPDSSIMRYTDGRPEEEIIASFESVSEQIKTFEADGNYGGLGETLMGDVNTRLLYFLRCGGRTKFNLINDYNFSKFTKVLGMGIESGFHQKPFETFEASIQQTHTTDASEQIMTRIKQGHFPFQTEQTEAVFACEVDVNRDAQVEQARAQVGQTLGSQELGLFVKAMMYRSFLDQFPDKQKTQKIEAAWKTTGENLGSVQSFVELCESTFGSALNNLPVPALLKKNASEELPIDQSTESESLDVNITKLEPSLIALGKKRADIARKAAQQNRITKQVRDERVRQYEQPETVLPALLSEELPPSFAPALNEWSTHIQAAIETSREARNLRKGETQVKRLQLRYLDKTTSLPEYLRFADSAMCCFTSKDFGDGMGAQSYIARIWKDPLSFVFHIEEPSVENSETRTSVGFVFGSYGTNRENQPVLLLNGVYMDRKTDLAARTILKTIEDQLGKPMGCTELLVAGQHGGKTNFGPEFSNTDREYLRLRALKERWGDAPERQTYDDIGLVAIGKDDEQTQSTGVLNQWAKTGKHIWRKPINQT